MVIRMGKRRKKNKEEIKGKMIFTQKNLEPEILPFPKWKCRNCGHINEGYGACKKCYRVTYQPIR